MTRYMVLSLMLVLFFAGCGAEKKRPAPGRCYVNSDCQEGFLCNDTYCEDIYFPRRDIKNY